MMDTLFPEVSFFFLVKQPLSSVQLRLKISIMGPKIEGFKGRIDLILVFNCSIRDLKKFSLSPIKTFEKSPAKITLRHLCTSKSKFARMIEIQIICICFSGNLVCDCLGLK